MVEVTCPRCGGSGRLMRFGHIFKGLCFRCEGAGKVQMRARADGTADHAHRIGFPDPQDRCVVCSLPVESWPPVVVAKWWPGKPGEYEIFLPGGRQRIFGATRRKTQAEARRLIVAALPNARIEWSVA